jgi:disease resistance protein RPM1
MKPKPEHFYPLSKKMYPEDWLIRMDELIWRWISEGFIRHKKTGDDLFELGKCYLDDLINRSLVQPTFRRTDDIWGCGVHDMILDLICSLSREENFVTTSDDMEQVTASECRKLRRLYLKNTARWPRKGVLQVRSVAAFQNCIDSMSPFSCLDKLRVLYLEDCSLEGSKKLSIGNLIHLRYLRLNIALEVLPRGIGKLQFLQVL